MKTQEADIETSMAKEKGEEKRRNYESVGESGVEELSYPEAELLKYYRCFRKLSIPVRKPRELGLSDTLEIISFPLSFQDDMTTQA